MKRVLIACLLFAGCAGAPTGDTAGGGGPGGGSGNPPQPSGGGASCAAAISDGYLIPCPTSNAFHPDLLYRQGVNVFTVGNNNSFSLLPAGVYVTTDGRSCSFTVGTDGSVQ